METAQFRVKRRAGVGDLEIDKMNKNNKEPPKKVREGRGNREIIKGWASPLPTIPPRPPPLRPPPQGAPRRGCVLEAFPTE